MVDAGEHKQFDPDVVAGQSFTRVRKGYEPDEVRAYLVGLASQLRDGRLRQQDLERRLAEVERRAADPRDLDEHAVTQLLGEETARVLEAARTAAADIRARAEESSTERLAEVEERDRSGRAAADQYSQGVRAGADEAARKVRDDADAYAAAVREGADAEALAQRSAAAEYDEQTRSTADAEVAELRATALSDVERMRGEASSVLAERTAEAETASSAILSEADAYSVRVRSDADRYAEATRTAADTYRTEVQSGADSYRTTAEADIERLRTEATEEADRIRTEATQDAERSATESAEAAAAALDEAREQGRAMVGEARGYRERVLADLADRRRAARAQLDKLAATRDALAVSITDVTAQAAASHRLLADTIIDPSVVGDVGMDREVLEASDADLNVPESESESESEPGLGDAGTDPDDAELEAVAVAEGDPAASVEEEPVEEEPVDPGGDLDGTDPDDAELEAVAVAEGDPAATVVEPPAAEPPVVESPQVESPAVESPAVGSPVDAETVESAATDPGDDGPRDQREGRIDAIFASIRADRQDEPDPTGEVDAEAATTEVAAVSDPADEPSQAADPVEPSPDGSDLEADLLDRRDGATDEIERQLARRLKRVLSDEQNETLDLLRRTKGTPSAEDVLPSDVDHHERYRSAALDDLSDAERAGAGFFGQAPDRRADVFDVAGDFATEIQGQIRSRLERAFEDGADDEQEVGERIRSCYREWKTQRIAETARHFVIVAFSRGIAEAADPGAESRWLVDDGPTGCPDCDDNALAGGVVKGEPFPTGDLCPPAHPGCRCLAVPVDLTA